MEGRGPRTVGVANNTRLLQFVEFIPGLLETDRIEATFGKNWRPGRLNVVDYLVMRRMAVQVSGENGGVLVDELANW